MLSFDLSNEAYHASAGISKSGLDYILKSPAHFQAYITQQQENTTAFLIGSATHCAILEPNKMLDRYVVADIDRRTKEGKAIAKEVEETGKEVLTLSQYDQVMGMANAVKKHGKAAEYLSDGYPEVSCFEEYHGVNARARADWFRRDGVIVDIKTTEDASPREFSKSCAKYGYHRQEALYRDLFTLAGEEIHTFVFVVVEKKAPYAVAVYELDDDSVEFGRTEVQRAISTYRECLAMNEWPGYPDEVKTISLPNLEQLKRKYEY